MAISGTTLLFPELPLNAEEIVDALMMRDRRVLLFGAMGAGKSTLASQLADTVTAAGRSCYCINADPGTPAFGVPGAASTATRHGGRWNVIDYAALCTLDAGRFRLPLASAVRQLAHRVPDGLVLIDAPGVIRGVAGRELLHALCEASASDLVLALNATGRPLPLQQDLHALSAEVYAVPAAKEAKRPGKRVRAKQRTALWNALLHEAAECRLDLDSMNITGTPPLRNEHSAWPGKQVALLRDNRTLAMGEVVRVDEAILTLRIGAGSEQADTLVVRDAVRSKDGYLETAIPYAAERLEYLPPGDVLPPVNSYAGPRIAGRVGPVDAALVNGVFGDPLLHLRLRHQRRSLLFDLGTGDRLPARIAHQVSDVFISHAHMDHIGGFLWLLRSRIGQYPACRLYGPPGLAEHIAGFLRAFLWDRVESNAPGFEVMELHDKRLLCFHLRAGKAQPRLFDQKTLTNTKLLIETGFHIRGITLDHGDTTVVAYAFEAAPQLNIRKDRLNARGLAPGPWLNTLKQCYRANRTSASIDLPDGGRENAGALADDLLQVSPGKKLVYATDLADTADNRNKLAELARHAHTFFCECSFSETDIDHATQNGHLTTRACGEIATEACVSRLVPFHFSRRYQHRTEQLYDELSAYCSRVCLPRSMAVFESEPKPDAVILID